MREVTVSRVPALASLEAGVRSLHYTHNATIDYSNDSEMRNDLTFCQGLVSSQTPLQFDGRVDCCTPFIIGSPLNYRHERT